ncbi:MAG: hypothetical protein U0167_12575 [bacterium]
MRRGASAVLAAVVVLGVAALAAGSRRWTSAASAAPQAAVSAPSFGDAFWKQWGDDQAEIATYDLTFPRYGEPRQGVAITIFVTETFSNDARVKADPGRHPKSDEFPVMKLNLVEDFATGVYDYNLLTSTFVALTPFRGRPAGSPAKVSFSSQEWCGHVYHQILLDDRTLRTTSHSYFDGEADRNETLPYPAGGVLEDALFHWARGLAGPLLPPSASVEVQLLRSTQLVRLKHVPLVWEKATLSRGAASTKLTVPAGTFEVETLAAEVSGDEARTWTFSVEVPEPHRIVRFEKSDGERGDLVAVQRLSYWKMNAAKFLPDLARIGLSPRPPRTP